MKKYIFSGLIAFTITVGIWTLNHQPPQEKQNLAGFSDPFISLQLATNPSNGDCLSTDGTNNIWDTCASGGGGGSGGGTFSTTTSTVAGQLINYPNNATDIVAIGSNSTTTAEFYYDPNAFNLFVKSASSTIAGPLDVIGNFRLPSISQGFAYIGSGGLINSTASSSILLSWLGGSVTDAQVPNTITIDLASAATALAANGTNASAGNAILGVDASGNAEGAFDVWTEAENTSAGYVAGTRTLTVAGTANQITSSAGAQDLSANRTWTLSIPSLFRIQNASSTILSVDGGPLYVGGTATTSIVGNLGTSTFSSFISAVSASTTATSTLAGINLPYGGCFAVGGVCVGSGSGSGTVGAGTTGQFPYYAANGTTLTATSGIFITPAGNVGMGTITPTDVNTNARLTVANVGAIDIIASTTDNTTSSTAILEAYAPGSRIFMGAHGTNQVTTQYGITAGGWGEIGAINSTFGSSLGLMIGTRTTNTPIVFGTGSLERMRILGTGETLLGTTTSSLNSTLTISSSTAPQFTLSAGVGISQWAFRNAGGNLYFSTTTIAGTATTSPAALSILGAAGNFGFASGTSSPSSAFGSYVFAGLSSATTTVTFGSPGDTTSKVCYNTKTSAGTNASFYINAAGAMVSELGLCK